MLNCVTFTIRHLYSPITLGIESYVQQRTRTNNQLGNIAEKFKTKMQDYTTSDSTNMIFTEDLKNMIHLAGADDTDLVMKMVKKFNEQNKQIRFGNFVFGPVVMRMYHHLNKAQEALDSFNNTELGGFYDQLMTYQILLDLLYENKMYNEMLSTFKVIQGRQIEATKYPRNIVVLALAACYKLNTPEALQFAIDLWKQLQEAGHFPMRRAVTFFGALALNHDKNEICLEVLATVKNPNYVTVRNLKCIALSKLGRPEEALALLKGSLQSDGPVKQTYSKEVLENVGKLIDKSQNLEWQQEFKRIEQYFQEHSLISEESLEEQLCSEIKPPPFLGSRPNPHYQQSRNNARTFNKKQKYERPGLADLN